MAVAVEEKSVIDELRERREEMLRRIEQEGDKLLEEFYRGATRRGVANFRKIVEECKTLTFADENKKYRLRGITHSGEQWDVLRSFRKTEEVK